MGWTQCCQWISSPYPLALGAAGYKVPRDSRPGLYSQRPNRHQMPFITFMTAILSFGMGISGVSERSEFFMPMPIAASR